MTRILGIEVVLKQGRTTINLINGNVFNSTKNITKRLDDYGAKKGMDKVRSMMIFTDADFVVEIADTTASFKCAMMDITRRVENIETEDIVFEMPDTFAPDENRVIIIASDEPKMPYTPDHVSPHLFYSNELEAKNASGSTIGDDADYQTILYKHTAGEKTKIQVFNRDPAGKAIWVDIQHKEMFDGDPNDAWVSYENYPKSLAQGVIESFGDDALLDTKHHYHRVRVKTQVQGEVSDVKAVIFGA